MSAAPGAAAINPTMAARPPPHTSSPPTLTSVLLLPITPPASLVQTSARNCPIQQAGRNDYSLAVTRRSHRCQHHHHVLWTAPLRLRSTAVRLPESHLPEELQPTQSAATACAAVRTTHSHRPGNALQWRRTTCTAGRALAVDANLSLVSLSLLPASVRRRFARAAAWSPACHRSDQMRWRRFKEGGGPRQPQVLLPAGLAAPGFMRGGLLREMKKCGC